MRTGQQSLGRTNLHAVEELGVLVLRLDGVHGGVEHLVPKEESPWKPSDIR